MILPFMDSPTRGLERIKYLKDRGSIADFGELKQT
jgi:hypothetical protein